jgi:integrase
MKRTCFAHHLITIGGRHGLRHSCITILLARGTHPKFGQHFAGDASIQLTFGRYSRWMLSMDRNSANRMDAALG